MTSKHSPFAVSSNYRTIQIPRDIPNPEYDVGSVSNINDTFNERGFSSEGYDDNLDRSLPAIPSLDSSGQFYINALTKVSDLSNGSSSQVSLVMFYNSQVALKKSKCPDHTKARERLEREAKVHQGINSHVNIVRFLGRAVQPDEDREDQIVGIITELCEFGDLSEAIEQASLIKVLDLGGLDLASMKDKVGYELYKDWIRRLDVLSSIVAGIVYMHSRRIVHGDLTSANVLFDSKRNNAFFKVKLCGFGRACYLPEEKPVQSAKALSDSAPWMGPEVRKRGEYGFKSDVYSIGTILWELMYLENPWTHLKEREGDSKLTIQQPSSTDKISLSISEDDAPDSIPEFPDLVRLVRRAWERDPENRPTVNEFYKEVREISSRMKERIPRQT